MTVISDALSAAQSAGSPTKALTADEQQDRFLKLLVTQLRNQDPLNPMDNAQITTQMAQISTVTGIDKLNETMRILSGSYDSGTRVQAASMIGRDVLVPGTQLLLDGTGAAGGVDLKEPADAVTVRILTPAGALVRNLPLGPQAAGQVPFAWDGTTEAGAPASPGLYRVEVQATRGGKPVDAATLTTGRVLGVTNSDGDVKLDIEGVGSATLSDVRSIH